jgi:hypothetical protein
MTDNASAGATPVVAGATPAQTPPPAGNPPPAPTQPATGDSDALGDAGKRALDAMKAERNAALAAAKTAEKAFEDLRLAGASESEKAIAKAKADGASEVTVRFHDQIRRSEVKLALSAAGITPNVLDLAAKADEFALLKVGDDGAIEGLDKAVATFKAARADLFRPTVGSADGGPRGTSAAGRVYKASELNDRGFYEKNREDINRAYRENRILADQ